MRSHNEASYEQLVVLDLSRGGLPFLLNEGFGENTVLQISVSALDFVKQLSNSTRSIGMIIFPPLQSGVDSIKQAIPVIELELFPLILVGARITAASSEIRKFLPHSIVFEPSSSANSILAAIQRLREARRATNTSRVTKPVSTPCFQALRKLNEDVTSTECADLFSSAKVEDFATNEFLPVHQAVLSKFSAALSKYSRTSIAHIYRTCAITQRLLQKLKGSSSELEVLRNSAALLSSSFVSHSHLLKINFSSTSVPDARTTAAALIEKTAQESSIFPELIQEKVVLNEVAHFTLKNLSSPTSEPTLLSSLLFLTDLANRTCWQDTTWNPRGAHSFLHEVGSSNEARFEPEALAICLKMVCETIETRGAGFTRKYCKFTPALCSDTTVARVGTLTPISQLLPGMMSNYSITTFDGKELVPPNTTLDSDLIWRLWRLSALRPVNSIWVSN